MRIRTRRIGRAGLVAVPVLSALALVAGAAPAQSFDSADAARGAVSRGHARNVIMLLGDGMGDSEITIARNYAKGAAGRLAMDTLPLTGEYTTYAVQKADPTKPEYVTDSAASGTGWSTGHKTYNGAISVTPDGKPQPTILEQAKSAGYRTGDITTAELTDATPAVLASHVVDRSCQGPANMAACPANDKANGGPGSIAEQEVQTGADVLMGGGKQRFDQSVTAGPFTGKTVTDQAKAAGYTVVTDNAGLAATHRNQRVLGLFSAGNMDLEWTGPLAAPFPANTTPVACTQSNPARPATMPHLSDMTRKAIDLLDAKSAGYRDKGFFLQVEGASIDKQDHAANPCGQIGETVEFDRSIAVALDYARSHRDTLVVVTADHGHTSQIIEYPQTSTHHSPGAIATLLTADGAPMVVNYATVSGAPSSSQDHTGTEVRIAAQGPQAYRVLGVTNQTDLFTTFRAALNLH
ncbi:alkaline phosphatase [Krasilnikovia sp. MM14-A1259]|uniref:alkaline phosphatase n=1 Tax=Krasilnikovia sp. MM14-A1259 TaxID=3373539 RepID=UPI0037FB4196